ncbi:MAG: hypothetical protein NTW72_12485 [Gemmatimonadetes bacterium]|nr:hypothetical protein [Gemmatimonadota bacterium]
MRRYAQVSGAAFTVIATGQLIRAVMRWPLQIADIAVPIWPSACAAVALAALSTWAYRTAKSTG